jgi:hypothetical protein
MDAPPPARRPAPQKASGNESCPGASLHIHPGFGHESQFDSRAAEAEDPGESEPLNSLTRRELSVCAKRNKPTCVRIRTDGEPKIA